MNVTRTADEPVVPVLDEREPCMDDQAIQALVARLARPHRSGGHVIERAAILAAGSHSAAVLSWIAVRGGTPERVAARESTRGLHSARLAVPTGSSTPQRFVLPPGALS